MQRVYIVTSEFMDKHGEREWNVCATFRLLYEAKKLLAEKRQNILDEYGMSAEELEQSDDYEVEDEDNRFYVQDFCGGWDEISITEQKIEDESPFIDIMFPFKDKQYIERIYLNDVDPDHYEDLWDWWFGDSDSRTQGDVTYDFELTANKHADGNFAMTGMYINVYLNDCDAIIATIPTKDIKIHTSWSKTKVFEPCQE